MDFKALHAHQEEYHRIAVNALRIIATYMDLSYRQVRNRFIDGDVQVTDFFWTFIHEYYPGQFLRVNWCHGCRKFGFEIKLAS